MSPYTEATLKYSVIAGAIALAWSGVILTAFTLPGIWIAIVGAALAQWFHSDRYGTDLYSWWTLGACVALGVIAEVAEIVASAFGAAKAGGSRKSSIASVAGAIIGAIAGTIFLSFLPIVGTIIGAALGAGLAALLTERHLGEKSWKDAGKVGAGAAAGRLAATLIKVGIAGVIALILTVAAFV